MPCENVAEKIAEATRKFAALQSDLSTAVAAEAPSNTVGAKRDRKRRSPIKSTKLETARKSMHDIKLAFSEFYLSLILLQNYQTLNFTGFRKILKKHDKVRIGFLTLTLEFFFHDNYALYGNYCVGCTGLHCTL